MTERNEIPGAAKLGKIYHFVWSVGTLDSETWDQQRKSPYFTNHGIIRCDDEQLKMKFVRIRSNKKYVYPLR